MGEIHKNSENISGKKAGDLKERTVKMPVPEAKEKLDFPDLHTEEGAEWWKKNYSFF